MSSLTKTFIIGLVSLALVACAPGAPTAAVLSSAARGSAATIPPNYYAGKTITLIAGSTAGGGTDAVVRTVAKNLGRFLAGNPTLVVENDAGAGGITGLNRVATAKPEGLLFYGSNSATLLYAQMQGQDQVRYDLSKMAWIGNAFQDSDVLWLRSSTPYKDWDAVRTASTPPKLGGQAATHVSVVTPKLITALTGVKFNIVVGYPGSPEVLLDVERGVLDGRLASWSSLKTQRPDWVTSGYLRFPLWVGHQRNPDLPDTPSLDEVTSPDKRDQLALVYSSYVMTRAMVGPAGMPPDLEKMVQDAYASMAKDPTFQADVAKTGFDPALVGAQELHDDAVKVLGDQTSKALLLSVLGQ